MKAQKILLFLLLLQTTLLSCNQHKVELIGSTYNPKIYYQKVGLYKLAGNLQSFDGMLVEVKGEFSYNFEDVALYNDGLFSDEGIRFWVNFKDGMTKDENQLKQLSGKPVIIRGKVNSKQKGHLGWYLAELDSVYYIKQQ
jgi:hypothetical protein